MTSAIQHLVEHLRHWATASSKCALGPNGLRLRVLTDWNFVLTTLGSAACLVSWEINLRVHVLAEAGAHLWPFVRQYIRIIELRRACSSAGRAPALQESGKTHTSAASGVAYADTRGATDPLNWTDVGPKRAVFGCQGAQKTRKRAPAAAVLVRVENNK